MTDIVPKLFDRSAARQRHARAARMHAADPAHQAGFLLQRVVEDFSDRLHAIRRTFRSAVDLGCYHGLLGRTLQSEHAIAGVTFADESAACLDVVKALSPSAITIAVDLECLPFRPATLDLVVSALALQTVNDLPGTLAQIRAALSPDGLLLAAIPGGRTLAELRESFLLAETEVGGGASPRVAPAIDVRDLGSLLQRAGFALPVVDSDIVTVTYAHPLALMHDLRAMGSTNILVERSRSALRRDVLAHAIDVYRQKFSNADGRIRATFEILTATAWSPHESQQKPLKPGSATTSLADALKPPPSKANNRP